MNNINLDHSIFCNMFYKLPDFRDSKSCVLSLERYEQVEYFHSFFVVNDNNNYNKTVKKNVKNSNNKNKFL